MVEIGMYFEDRSERIDGLDMGCESGVSRMTIRFGY